MTSVLAQKWAQGILDEWAETPGRRMVDLIAIAIDLVEEIGYERGYATREEELAALEVDVGVIRSACLAAGKHPMGGSQKEPHCSYPLCETDQNDPHYGCNCPTAVRAAFDALEARPGIRS